MTQVNSVSELLALHGEEFVDAAYQLVLSRAPDEQGMIYYLARLRTGYSKLSVLHQIGKSGERGSWDTLPGLRSAMRRYRIGRSPLVGWMFRSFCRVEGETTAERLQRAMISELAVVQGNVSAVQEELRSAGAASAGLEDRFTSAMAGIQSELGSANALIRDLAAGQSDLRDAAAAVVAPGASLRSGTGPLGRANLVAEQLSPDARQIFDQLVSG